MANTIPTPQKTPKVRKSRKGKSLKNVNLDYLYKQLINILARETKFLLEISGKGKLERDDAMSLCNYIKLFQYLTKKEEEDLEKMSDEDLAKLVKVKADEPK